MLLKAYNQNGNLEKEISLLETDNWKMNAMLYENMIYSNGAPIDYAMKLDSSCDYLYTVLEVGNGYKITAALKKQEGMLTSNDENISNKVEIMLTTTKNTDSTIAEKNPKTSDNIIVYIFMFFLSFSSLVITLKPIMKKAR